MDSLLSGNTTPRTPQRTELDLQTAGIGPFYSSQATSSKALLKWKKMENLCRKQSASPFDAYAADPRRAGKFFRRVKQGPPGEYRWEAWKTVVQVASKVAHSSYKELPNAAFSTMRAIYKDLDRTYPELPYFNKEQYGCLGQGAMQRVLGKLAGKHPELGYCQAMNFIAGFLLLLSGSSEEEAFYMMETLLYEYNLSGFYVEGMPYLQKTLWVFKRIFKGKHPKLWTHFKEEGMNEALWVVRWFLTLFTSDFPHSLVVRFWDYFLVEGICFLYKIPLAILKRTEKELLKTDLSGICDIFKNLKNELTDETGFIQEVVGINLNFYEIKDLERAHSLKIKTNNCELSPQIRKLQKPTIEKSYTMSPQHGLIEEIYEEPLIYNVHRFRPRKKPPACNQLYRGSLSEDIAYTREICNSDETEDCLFRLESLSRPSAGQKLQDKIFSLLNNVS